MSLISIANDFSSTPGGRFRTDGPFSGEQFREDVLIPALGSAPSITVELDGTRGYPSSFLDEAFAGLVRKKGWSADEFKKHITIIASGNYQIYYDDIMLYVEEAASQRVENANSG